MCFWAPSRHASCCRAGCLLLSLAHSAHCLVCVPGQPRAERPCCCCVSAARALSLFSTLLCHTERHSSVKLRDTLVSHCALSCSCVGFDGRSFSYSSCTGCCGPLGPLVHHCCKLRVRQLSCPAWSCLHTCVYRPGLLPHTRMRECAAAAVCRTKEWGCTDPTSRSPLGALLTESSKSVSSCVPSWPASIAWALLDRPGTGFFLPPRHHTLLSGFLLPVVCAVRSAGSAARRGPLPCSCAAAALHAVCGVLAAGCRGHFGLETIRLRDRATHCHAYMHASLIQVCGGSEQGAAVLCGPAVNTWRVGKNVDTAHRRPLRLSVRRFAQGRLAAAREARVCLRAACDPLSGCASLATPSRAGLRCGQGF